ncbi:uncharacterized protein LOC125230393 [Leguminivora glycinivorella]|uniref:uncharacterized protein LOC125230393 n=1 Tax=Leguminivora glycinivorella TaxID=1035111 RepID=UPI0020104C58|nr:uncharacterized protein LOC125230393 [Leguminivora glycinivorella]
MTRGALIVIAVVLLMADFSNGHPHPHPTSYSYTPSSGVYRTPDEHANIHDLLRKVLTNLLVEEDVEKEAPKSLVMSSSRLYGSGPGGEHANIHDLLRKVLTNLLVEEDAEKDNTRDGEQDAYDVIKRSLKARMDAEDSRKTGRYLKPVAHNIANKALTDGLISEDYADGENGAIHQAVRQAVVSGLIVEHNPRSGTTIIHDAVRKSVK